MTVEHTDDRTVRFLAQEPGRLDTILARHLQSHPEPGRELSRSALADMIREGRVTVRGVARPKPSHAILLGDPIELLLPPPPVSWLAPETHDFGILYTDDHLIVIDKPAGLKVHPTASDPTNSLVAGILGRGLTLSPVGAPLRPGVVHRLDKTTSGVMVLARTEAAHHGLVRAFAARELDKRYLAITRGHLPAMEGRIEAPIGRHATLRKRFTVTPDGRPADTSYVVERRLPVADLVQLTLGTGRTHQIRVHLEHLRAPVMGDTTYGGKLTGAVIGTLSKLADGYGGEEGTSRRGLEKVAKLLWDYPGNLLQARELGFAHPVTGESLRFVAEPPAIWAAVLAALEA